MRKAEKNQEDSIGIFFSKKDSANDPQFNKEEKLKQINEMINQSKDTALIKFKHHIDQLLTQIMAIQKEKNELTETFKKKWLKEKILFDDAWVTFAKNEIELQKKIFIENLQALLHKQWLALIEQLNNKITSLLTILNKIEETIGLVKNTITEQKQFIADKLKAAATALPMPEHARPQALENVNQILNRFLSGEIDSRNIAQEYESAIMSALVPLGNKIDPSRRETLHIAVQDKLNGDASYQQALSTTVLLQATEDNLAKLEKMKAVIFSQVNELTDQIKYCEGKLAPSDVSADDLQQVIMQTNHVIDDKQVAALSHELEDILGDLLISEVDNKLQTENTFNETAKNEASIGTLRK